MRADAHYVEQLDGATPAVTVQFIAVHVARDPTAGRRAHRWGQEGIAT